MSVMIPCHRAVGADGNLTGYAGGMDKKIKLLTCEGVDMEMLFVKKQTNVPYCKMPRGVI